MESRPRCSTVGLCLASVFTFLFVAKSTRAERGSAHVTPPAHGSSLAPAAGRGHFGAEIEGVTTDVNTTDGTITIQDQRLGSVVVTVDDNTIIRHGWQAVALGDIIIGAQVHAKATPQDGGGFLAAAIFVQDNGTGSGGQGASENEDETEIQGTVKNINCGSNTMTVTTDSGDVDVTLQDSTVFKKQGNVAACGDITLGDTVEVSGATQNDGSILADKVTIEAPEVEETEIAGTIKAGSIDSVALTFIVTTDTGDVKIQTNSETIFKQDGDLKTFGDLADGMSVEVEGFLQGDGSIVATKVSIEGSED